MDLFCLVLIPKTALGEFLSRPPAVLDSNGVKRLAGSSEYRREYLKHPLNGSGEPRLEEMNFAMAGFGLFGFKTKEVQSHQAKPIVCGSPNAFRNSNSEIPVGFPGPNVW